MKKIQLFFLIMVFLLPISISSVYAQTLYVDAEVGNMEKIKGSKYMASGVSILRNDNGDLVSVVRVDATRYLNHPIVEEFLKSDPKYLVKQGIIDNQRINLYKVEVDYYNPECLEKIFNVPGYNDPCNWYHRAYVTMLGINDPNGESYFGFRGLNHVYTIKSLDTVTTIWNILSKN